MNKNLENRFIKMKLLTVYYFFFIVAINSCLDLQPKQKKTDMNLGKNCWQDVQIDIPSNAIFYYAQVSQSEINSLGNLQWMLTEDGKVFHIQNSSFLSYGNKPSKVFNTTFDKQPLAILPQDAIEMWFKNLQELGIEELESKIPTPENIDVKDGYFIYLYAKFEGSKKCIEFGCGVELGQKVYQNFMTTIEPYIIK